MSVPVSNSAPLDPGRALIVGGLWMTAASGLLALLAALIRMASDHVHPLEIVFFRNLFGVVLMMPMLGRLPMPYDFRRRWPLFGARGLTSFAAMATWFFAVSTIALADAVALNFTLPLFATLLAVLVLGEVVRGRRWTALGVGFLGTVIVLRPGFTEVSAGTIAALASAGFMAASAVSIRKMSAHDGPAVITFWSNIVMTPISLVPALFVWTWPGWQGWLWLLGVGAVAIAAQICLSRAYGAAPTSAVMPFDFTRLPFAVLIGLVWFGEVPDPWTLVGAAVIIGSAIYITRREARLAGRPVTPIAAEPPDPETEDRSR
ncbi:membrane protein [Tistrella bauzanensis]|uniref:Membrane protein n=1 Tax=Tistrella bauzanensis TaxID=657419 RepID=A0ABQ1IYA6_9PROT|nr:DMT family transporter [Tistrella bauzanensis]GGB55381.1 membrane protein [Tistrella bauzanensis]